MKAVMQPPPRSPPHRQNVRLRAAILAMMLVSAALVTLDTVMWFRLEHGMDRRLDRFARQARAAGWRFSAQTGARGGWPFSATLTLHHPALRFAGETSAAAAGAVAWSGEAMTLSVSPWRPDRPAIVAEGTQTLTLASRSRPPLPLRFWGARIALLLPPEDDVADDRTQARQIALTADTLHMALPGSGPDDVLQAAAAAGTLRWAADMVTISFALRDIALPMSRGQPEGRIVQSLRFDATLAAKPESGGSTGIAWPGAGSTIRLDDATMRWDGDDAALSGNAVLGPDGILDGEFGLTASAPDRMLTRARDLGLIGAGPAIVAHAVVGLILAAGPGPVHLALQLQHGLLRLGEIPLLRLQPLGTTTDPDPPARMGR